MQSEKEKGESAEKGRPQRRGRRRRRMRMMELQPQDKSGRRFRSSVFWLESFRKLEVAVVLWGDALGKPWLAASDLARAFFLSLFFLTLAPLIDRGQSNSGNRSRASLFEDL